MMAIGHVRRFVYVARLKTGDEVGLRRLLEHLPDAALDDAGFIEFTSYVGSGYCVLQFSLPIDDFQVRYERFQNDERVREFTAQLATFLVEGDEIARVFSTGDPRFHPGIASESADAVSSADLPLAYAASHWPRDWPGNWRRRS